jgi:adenylate cyclase
VAEVTEPKPSAPTGVPESTVEDRARAIEGGPAELTIRDLVAKTGVDLARVQSLCRALGTPLPEWDQPAFTAADLQALEWVTEVVDYGVLNEGTELSLLRALSHTAERLAWWQFETLADDAARRFELDDVSARMVVVDRIADLADIMEEQMIFAWRRNLARAIRWIGDGLGEARDGATADPNALPLSRAVGFADLVGYTEISEGLAAAELDQLVQDFETITREVVERGGGRVVKTIGDAMMFVTDHPLRAALIALELAQRIGAEGRTPPARVAMVWGRVLARFGDVFGPTVNLAARLAEVAAPGEVLVDQRTAQALREEAEVETQALPPSQVAGIGQVFPYRLTARGPGWDQA